MAEQSDRAATSSNGDADESVRVEQPRAERVRESTFTNQVISSAHYHGWQTFHLRDRDSIHIVSGRGFPDLVMYREDPETGDTELITAELKRGYDSELRPEQDEWMKALRHHIPAYEWRPEDWDDIENVLKDGPGIGDTAPQPREHQWSTSQIPRNFRTVITCLAETIEAKEYGTGNRAQLRRMTPDRPDSAAFWKLMVRDGMPRNPDLAKWGLITHGMALMAHGGGLAHTTSLPVGRVLYLGGERQPGTVGFYSEDRLSTLLAARGPTLHRLLSRLFRMLGSEGCAFNWHQIASLILNEGNNDSRADEARVQIARDYFQTQSRNSRTSDN